MGWGSERSAQKSHHRSAEEADPIVLLIDSKLIKADSKGNRIARLHWIVIKPGTAVWSEDGERVSFTYFTWGAERVGHFRMKGLIKYLYVTIVRE